MEAKMDFNVTGVRGGNAVFNENKGKITVFVDHTYSNTYNDLISVDAFEGYGESYKRREKCLVQIQFEGNLIFHGTMEELKNKLSK
jgi:hypothetical protein